MLEAKRQTLQDYNLRVAARELGLIDDMERFIQKELVSRTVHATNKDGKYIVKSVSDIYDAHAEREKVLYGKGEIKSLDRLMQITRNLEAYKREKEASIGK